MLPEYLFKADSLLSYRINIFINFSCFKVLNQPGDSNLNPLSLTRSPILSPAIDTGLSDCPVL